MVSKKAGYLGLVLAINLAAGLLVFGLLDISSAAAQAQARSFSLQPGQSPQAIQVMVDFPDSAIVEIRDLSGNLIGAGEHGGMFMCVFENCSQKTRLAVSGLQSGEADLEYKFTTLQVSDPLAGIVVVAGRGKISSQGRTEHFQFTAAIQDNFDGTLSASYVASRPEASFLIRAPGQMELQP